jgi:predicted dehydrogenase
MNGVTGRMGSNQHLKRSIVPILNEGGVQLSDNEFIMPDPVLVGRNSQKLEKLARNLGLKKWTVNIDEVINDPTNIIYFDAQTTGMRFASVKKAIEAGKNVYCEKPSALTTEKAYELYSLAEKYKVIHGVVQDKLWLPGILKLKNLISEEFFGKILSVRGDFGYWVFEGDQIPAQRPSWNYRKKQGGGIILDMFPHWCYILENLFGSVISVFCLGTTFIKKRWDENKRPYKCTADDAAYAIFKLENGIIAQFHSSWINRVRRDDLLTIQIDGTQGSAVCGLRKCYKQSYSDTPRPTWNPDVKTTINYYDDWLEVPGDGIYDNAFKIQWELFLKHVVKNKPFQWDLLEGTKGVLLAEKGYESWREKRTVNIPHLESIKS